jgi:iron-sulfur cluster repair protein YtfE (RIC family)
MQQHNMKEEQVLYAMLDAALGPEAEKLLAAFASAG